MYKKVPSRLSHQHIIRSFLFQSTQPGIRSKSSRGRYTRVQSKFNQKQFQNLKCCLSAQHYAQLGVKAMLQAIIGYVMISRSLRHSSNVQSGSVKQGSIVHKTYTSLLLYRRHWQFGCGKREKGYLNSSTLYRTQRKDPMIYSNNNA